MMERAKNETIAIFKEDIKGIKNDIINEIRVMMRSG